MGNIAFNKPAQASSFVSPYAPSRAVDGSVAPFQRWLCNSTPCWLSVDLQGDYWINRWQVKHLPNAGWSTPDYVLSNYKLQGSLDGYNWFDLDLVSNNTLATTNRTFTPVQVSYVRLYVTGGLRVNPQMASVCELEIYEAPPTSAFLSNLTVSSGSLVPTFSSSVFAYQVEVANGVDKIAFVPTAQDPEATIKVNGVVVPSGSTSGDLPLVVGNNTITVQVTPKVGNPQNYTVTVVRGSSAALSGLVLKAGGKNVTINPSFSKETLAYTAMVSPAYSTVTVTPTAEDPEATIKVNGVVVPSGSTSGELPLTPDSNPINIQVTAKIGGAVQTYTINVISTTYLTGLVLKAGGKNVTLTPSFVKETLTYSAVVSPAYTTVTVTPTAEDPGATIKVNGSVVASGATSDPISVVGDSATINVQVIARVGIDSKTYVLNVRR